MTPYLNIRLLLRGLPLDFLIRQLFVHILNHGRANPRFCSPEPSEYKALARKFNNWLQRWKVPYRKFLTWGSNRFENPNLFQPDLIHLNENGLIVFWNLFEDLLIKVKESFFVQ